jgi:hypothetical protein
MECFVMNTENPPAFPRSRNEGMTLRDWFAGQALPVVIASYNLHESWSWSMSMLASDAYSMADAMLAARKDTTP